MNPNEQKAQELVQSWRKWDGHIEQWIRKVIVPKLLTPDHEAALAACEERSKYPQRFWPEDLGDYGVSAVKAVERVIDIGRRSLDAKTPKERYYVEKFDSCAPDEYRVRDRSRLSADVRGFGTKAECEAIAATLAALDAKEAARV